jgi:phosphate uptake regulator
VDELNRAAYGVFKTGVSRYPERVDELLSLLEICQFLERLCDHITSIAKEIIFLIEGEIKRHKKRQALRCWIATVEGEENPSSAPSISTLFAGTPRHP